MLKITHKGNFDKTKAFLRKNRTVDPLSILHRYGQKGVAALSANTPITSGETANSWSYEIVKTKNGYRIDWINSHMAGSVPVVILLQYGHATKNGGYVQGIDFINPALTSTFEGFAFEIWKEVSNE